MKILEIASLVLSVALFASPMAYARNCELPHEQLQARCGGEMKDFFNADADLNSEAVSAVDKSPKASLKEQVAGYRQRAEAMGAVVKKANDDYRDYLLSKKR